MMDLTDCQRIILAFDIERAGATDQFDTIAIGACVVDDKFRELDSLFLPGLQPDYCVFEERCWDEFWSKHQDTLKTLEYDGPLSNEERQEEMIVQFHEFRKKWEQIAEEANIEYVIVSDNTVYDGGFINDMMFKHMPGILPLPYSAYRQEYSKLVDLHQCQMGLLMAVDPTYKQYWGLSNRIKELYNIPQQSREHDHNPTNDAYTIAFELQCLYAIRDGTIERKTD